MIALEAQSFKIVDAIKEDLPTSQKLKKLTKILLQLHTNYEILKHFNKTLDFEDFMMDALITVNKLLDIDQLLLFLYENESLNLISIVSENSRDLNISLTKGGNCLLWEIFNSQKTYIFNNLNGIRNKFYGPSLKIGKEIKSLLALPLFDRNKNTIGLLTAHSRNKNIFNEVSLPFYQELAIETSKTLERSRQYSILKELSFLDELTGLYNRRFLNIILEKEVKRSERYGGHFSLVIADMNNFKKVNDLYGHLKGDEILKEVAGVIKSRLRSSDIPARYGGDEFAIILYETNRENATKIMNDINKRIRKLEFNFEFQISLAFGISTYPESARDIKNLIELADKDLYSNKKFFAPFDK